MEMKILFTRFEGRQVIQQSFALELVVVYSMLESLMGAMRDQCYNLLDEEQY